MGNSETFDSFLRILACKQVFFFKKVANALILFFFFCILLLNYWGFALCTSAGPKPIVCPFPRRSWPCRLSELKFHTIENTGKRKKMGPIFLA